MPARVLIDANGTKDPHPVDTPASSVSRTGFRHSLFVALGIAALTNAFVPAVLFANTNMFGHTDLRHRALVVFLVAIEYGVVFLFLRFRANVGFTSGYTVATAAIVTLASALLGCVTVYTSSWRWNATVAGLFAFGWFAFALLSNLMFFVASVRWARVIHPRLHLGGFVFGIAVSLVVVFIYLQVPAHLN